MTVATHMVAGIALMLASSAGAQTNLPLETTYWRATELAGKAPASQNQSREPHLVFQSGGRVTGSDGCNRITGSYELKGEGILFGPQAGTQMACPDTAETERRFHS